MFFVFNKDKIFTYGISILTVFLLFCFANNMIEKKEDKCVSVSNQNKLLPIYRVDTKEKKVSLTLNCAWNDYDIDKILKVLNDNNCKVTFFIVGKWAEKYPEAVKKIKEAGHELATHSYSHLHVNNLSYEENKIELEKGAKVLENISGEKVKLYRTPYGEYNDKVIKVANESGYFPIQWSIDTLDYTNLDGNKMWKRIEGKLNSGDIILMHNGTKYTSDLLDMIIKNIMKKGYKIVTVSKLIYFDDYLIDINGEQSKNR